MLGWKKEGCEEEERKGSVFMKSRVRDQGKQKLGNIELGLLGLGLCV